MPVALISAQTYQALILYLGGKTTVLGDKVSVSGHAGAFMSFNIFVTNQLPFTTQLTYAAQASDGDTFTWNGLTFTWRTSPSLAGEIKILGSVALDQANLKAILAAPFTAITTNYPTPQTNNVTNQIKLANISVGTFTSNQATITQGGIGTALITAVTFTSASNFFTGKIQHNIFGVSRSVAIVIQKYPELYVNPVSGKVGKDYVTWCYYGIKVFKYQTFQLIDTWVDCTNFAQPQLIAN